MGWLLQEKGAILIKNRTKRLVSNEYIRYSFFMLTLIGLMACGTAYFIWNYCAEDKLKKAEQAGNEIERYIQRSFEEMERILRRVGKEISEEAGEKNPEIIAENLKRNVKNSNYLVCYNWTCLDWVNNEQYLVANSIYGALHQPIKVKGRKYLIDGPQNPWNLIVCSPARGFSTGEWVIPMGMGITDEDDHLIGILTLGLNIEEFTYKIRGQISCNDISFIVTDSEKRPIFYSPDISNDQIEKIAPFLFDQLDSPNLAHRSFPRPIQSEAFNFYTYSKLQKYPYDIFVGFNSNFIHVDFYSRLFPWLLSFFCFGLCSLCMIFLFMRKKLRPFIKLIDGAVDVAKGNNHFKIDSGFEGEPLRLAHTIEQISYLIEERKKSLNLLTEMCQQQKGSFEELKERHNQLQKTHQQLTNVFERIKESETCRNAFTEKVNQELESAILSIFCVTQILINNLEGGVNVPLDAEAEMEKLSKILENIQTLRNLTRHELSIGEVDAVALIQEAILIHDKTAILRNIEIKLSMENSSQPIYLDELKFKQIIVGILAYVIFQSPDHGIIDLILSTCNIDDDSYLQVLIKDKGFGLTRQDMERIESKFGFEWGQFVNLTVLKVAEIDVLIELHHGKMQIESKWQAGTSIKILIPFDLPNKLENNAQSSGSQSSVLEEGKIVNIVSL